MSSDQSRAPCYPSSSMTIEHQPNEQLGSADDVKEWEEARCPICIEHPHNAILLKCSSHEKGCRPYMCNTSYRHSNCLDQFCKSFAPHASKALLQEIPLTSSAFRSREDGLEPGQARHYGSHLQPKLSCPLCRGEIYGYSIVESARKFMNSKPRSCSSEICGFSSTYSELRRHARSEHPSIRPSEVDPVRQRDWARLERERDLEDIISSLHPEVGEESGEESTLPVDSSDWLSIFELMFCSLGISLMVGLSDISSDRELLHNRRSGRIPRVDYDMEVSHVTGRNNNLSSESIPRLRQTTSWTHDDTRRSSNLSSVRVPHHQQMPGWSSESVSDFWSSQNGSSFSSYGRPRFRQMPGQSQGSTHSLAQYPRQLPENMPHSRRLHWRGERWSPYNNQH